ncbi:hypothetical protein CYMTET_20723 [Cymbomonas tetramitiformis]|uniref:PPIase cyclophilin-type domain-containing protein n=1 Tax=Cymbomonas tetramitiformis TaxID=36881 RepID=A0AAE0L3W4_9CHLO|nr:hypothetical protein CYMTET_20723 [Cymbomonas tetramitiformis]
MTRDSLPRVYFEVSADEISIGQIVFELREDVAPNTTKGFLEACNAEKGFVGAGLDCSAAQFYKMIPIEHSQLDDDNVLKGLQCKDERFELKHDQPGLLSAVNDDEADSRFFISVKATPRFNGKHVVFGKAVEGLDVLKKLESLGRKISSLPQVLISRCGQIGPENESTEATCASAETSSTGSQHEPEDNNAETATVTSDKLKETQMQTMLEQLRSLSSDFRRQVADRPKGKPDCPSSSLADHKNCWICSHGTLHSSPSFTDAISDAGTPAKTTVALSMFSGAGATPRLPHTPRQRKLPARGLGTPQGTSNQQNEKTLREDAQWQRQVGGMLTKLKQLQADAANLLPTAEV